MQSANWTRRDLLKTGASALAAASLPLRPPNRRPKARPTPASSCGWEAAPPTWTPSIRRRAATAREGRLLLRLDRDGDPRRAGLRASASNRRRCSTAASWCARCNHTISGEHGAAANLVHTGRMPSGTMHLSVDRLDRLARAGAEVRRRAGVRRDGLSEHHARPGFSGREVRLRLSAADRDRTERPGAPAGRGHVRARIAANRCWARLREGFVETASAATRMCRRRRRSASRASSWPGRGS